MVETRVCAPGYTGRKRGQVVRTRTVESFAHRGRVGSAVLAIVATGARRVELRKGRQALARYLAAYQLPQARTLLRLDGQYGTGAVRASSLGFAFVTRGKDYRVLAHPLVKAAHASAERLSSSNGQQRQLVRSLYDCESVPVGPEGLRYRVVVATR